MAISPDDSPSSQNLEPEKSMATTWGKDKAVPRTTSDEDTHAVDGGSLRSGEGEDILARQALDPALNLKMHLVNNVSCFPCDLVYLENFFGRGTVRN